MHTFDYSLLRKIKGPTPAMMQSQQQLLCNITWPSLASLHKYYSRGVGVARAPSSAKQPPRVYLLSMYKEPPVSLQEGLRALKAYSLCRQETVNIELKCKVKVRWWCGCEPWPPSHTHMGGFFFPNICIIIILNMMSSTIDLGKMHIYIPMLNLY